MFTLVDMPADKADTPHVSLQDALRAAIHGRDHSHAQAAEAIGTTQQTVSSWAAGKSLPKPASYAGLAKYLRTTQAEVRALVAVEKASGDRVSRLERQVAELSELVGHLVRHQFPDGLPPRPG